MLQSRIHGGLSVESRLKSSRRQTESLPPGYCGPYVRYRGNVDLVVSASEPHEDSKLQSTEDPQYMCAFYTLNHMLGAKRPPPSLCGMEVWRGGCQLRCRPRHETVIRNDEVRPEIALVLLLIN
ncbi:hypothetical protein AVEN_171532-1 [Araneus ventricosus]|uniref:Uncharacterized protein n=1 Tax=Araneus ventricosus TaxID=182803 RepID=A0A4Y2MAT7_ARAVE|nr:hypothetical protein AVEN_171532-1 [Araneus ventricosus]